jgi:membrane protease YdiL (CAAX protease family)
VRAGLGVGTGVALWVLSIGIANAQAAVIGAHPQSLIVAAAAHRTLPGLVIDLFFGAGVVAVVEELFFRVVLFSLFRQRMRFAYAAILSSALFAVAHEISAWLPVFALGMALAYLYEKRHSLWTNALAHGTLNAISFLLLFLLPDLGS